MAILVASISGPQYIYPTYGTSLATKFQWTALQNSVVSTACFMGVSFSGPLCSWLIERFGFKSTLRLSALIGFFGNFMLAQTYRGVLASHFQLCAIYLVLTGFASSAAYLCALDSQSHNFRHHRGMAMGFTSATLGLCGLIFSQINDYFFKAENGGNDDTSVYQFLVFLSIVTSTGMLIPSFILGPLPDSSSDLHGIDEVVYQDISSYNPSDFDLTMDDDACSSNPTLVDDDDDDDNDTNNNIKDDTPLLLANNMIYKPTNYVQDVPVPETCEQSSISGLALFTHPISLTLFLALFVTLGVGYVYLASLGQILLSLPQGTISNPQHVRNTHVSLFSIANCAARAVFGTLSDVLKNQYGIHRLWLYWAGLLGLILAQLYLVMVVSSADALIPCTVGMALVYGLAFGVAPAATAEFGTEVSSSR
ncbi:major facilitator superfamily domain-containing protein [Chlamydoabsidia padenii]|nr:major facilitator superfamily domain-containing protein [Chlamydoabsidia padenii]